METLYEKFPSMKLNEDGTVNTDKTRVAVLGTVKNAQLAKKVISSGQARGMRYHWVNAPTA
jgi:hypothetical protein